MTKQYKLISSEVIVCTLKDVADDQSKCIAVKPLQLIMSPGMDNAMQMMLIPWMNKEVILKKDSIMGEADLPPQVEQQYIKMTTGIQLANNTPNNIKLVR